MIVHIGTKQTLWILWATLFSVCFAKAAVDIPQALKLNDAAIFSDKHFADKVTHSDAAIYLAGLAQLYPKKIISELPPEPKLDKRSPLLKELPRKIQYIRFYNLQSKTLETLQENIEKPALILDLRFLHDGAGAPLETIISDAQRKNPILVLINSKTAGPFEIALENLKDSKKILTLGTATQGQTGRYKKLWEEPTYYIIENEHLPISGQSILESGVVPEVAINVNMEEDYQAYYSVEKGIPLDSLITFNLEKSEPSKDVMKDSEDSSTNEPAPQIVDKTLQRSIEIIAALQILGNLSSF